MIKEKDWLELTKQMCDFYYAKTEDKWYEKVSKQIEKKLNPKRRKK